MFEREYENRIVAYLDILGFKNIVEDSVNNKKTTNDIYYILNDVLYTYKDISDRMIKSKVYKRSVSTLSDCIIMSISINGEKERVDDFITDILEIQQILLYNKFLLRGAITIGDIIHNNNVVFGPAVNRVVQLEKEEALYPRVIIDHDVLSNSSDKKDFFELSIHKQHIINYDEKCIINYKLDNEIYRNCHRKELLKKYIDIQLNRCESISCKYKWLKNYLFG